MAKIFKVNQGCKVKGIQETIYSYDPEFDLESGDAFEVIYESIDSSFNIDGYYIQVLSGNFQNEQMIIEPEELSPVKVTELKEDDYKFPLFDDYTQSIIDMYNENGYNDEY